MSGDAVSIWFDALEELGEYIGIRYGVLTPGKKEIDWVYRSHKDYDGIGAFAEILREDGLVVHDLPQITHPAKPSLVRTLALASRASMPRRRVDWSEDFKRLADARPEETEPEPSTCIAWHLFDANQTKEILRATRQIDVTVNSFLLRLLDKAIRPDIADRSQRVPWMIPVNLRGRTEGSSDTENHSAALMIHTHPEQRFDTLHKLVYEKLQKGEHWSVWENYRLTAGLPLNIKKKLIISERAMPQWNIGSFSNLGVWNLPDSPDEKSYVFLPPVLRCQWLGAGALTYKGKLGLAIQAHPCIATNPEIAKQWMRRWVDEIAVSIPADV